MKTKLKLIIGRIISFIDPLLLEKIQDQLELIKNKREKGELKWQVCGYGPQQRYASAGCQIKNLMYVVGGYETIDKMAASIDVFDMETETWAASISLPEDAAESHCAVVADGERYIYIVSGQKGPRCSPSTRRAFSFDTETGHFTDLPSLPEGKYALPGQIMGKRLHVVCGANEDRLTASKKHWSLGIDNGVPSESEWREEPSIPKPGAHMGSAVVDGYWYVLAGQDGETPPKPNDPRYSYSPGLGNECVYADCFRWKVGDPEWEEISEMPEGVSHHDASVVVLGKKILVIGGMSFQDPVTKEISLTDKIQELDTSTLEWKLVGRLPFRVKSMVCGYWKNKLYFATGQKDRSPVDARPYRFLRSVWKTEFSEDRD